MLEQMREPELILLLRKRSGTDVKPQTDPIARLRIRHDRITNTVFEFSPSNRRITLKIAELKRPRFGQISIFLRRLQNGCGNTDEKGGDRKSTRLNYSHVAISYA